MLKKEMADLRFQLQKVGLTMTQLMQEERNGGCVTESHLKLILIQWGRKLDLLANGQAPDHLHRLQELELLGKNPQGESQIDITEMALGLSHFSRRLTKAIN